jgi:hypothetical protein
VRFLTAAALALCACATRPEPEPAPPMGPPISVIHVHSWPPGMAVELDEEFVGITPCQVPVRTTEDFTWPGRHVVVMRCRPVTGGRADIKYWRPGQRVPQRVLFSLPWAPAPRPATALVR